jgi:putative hydrolase of HD superfamily
MEENDNNGIKKYFSEIEMLKRVKREGFRLAGVNDPESIADHIVVSSQIAYILGFLEGANAEKCALINLFHENSEIRLGDQHKVSARYFNNKEAEAKSETDIACNIPKEIGERILELSNEIKERKTIEGIVSKDADWLEAAIQAKIYLEQGYSGCQDWIDNVEKALETKSAKEILKLIKDDADFTNCWWRGLKKMTYEKLDCSY